jgi:hypothetical protein
VEELLATFGQSDEVTLLPLAGVDADSSALQLTSPAVALEQLQRLQAGFRRARYQNGLDLAGRLLDRSQNLNKEIYLVTDRQRASLPADIPDSTIDAAVYVVDLPLEENENLGVIALDMGGQLIEPGVPFEIEASVRNYGGDPATERLASLFINGRRVAQAGFECPAGGESVIRFEHTVSRTGFHSGYIELSDDKFRADNRYYFSFDIPERFNLLIVDSDRSASYLKLALVPDESLSRFWSVKEVTPDQLSGVDFSDYDVIFLAGVPRLDQRFVDRMQGAVRRGPSLFIVYSPDTEPAAFNAAWSDISGVTISRGARTQVSRAGFFTLASLDMEHPIFSVFSFEDGKIPEIKFYTLPIVRTAPDARIHARFSGDRPALVEYSFGRGRILTFTGPLDVAYSDLPAQAFFVPFVSRTAEYLASDLSGLDLRLFCGDRITRTLPIASAVEYPPRLIAPDSSEYRLVPEEQQGLLVVRPQPVDIPGIYSIRLLGREIDRFAVNLSPVEADLSAIDIERFVQALNLSDARPLAADESLDQAVAEYRYGREFWQLFLWAVLVLLAVEMLLSRGRPVEE